MPPCLFRRMFVYLYDLTHRLKSLEEQAGRDGDIPGRGGGQI